jgi:stage III sporulation protein AA
MAREEMEMNRLEQRIPLFLQDLMNGVPISMYSRIEEIRVRQGRPIEYVTQGQSWCLTERGVWSVDMTSGEPVDETFCRCLLDKLTGHSVYSFEEQLRRGYITAEGGHRVGLSGQVVLQDGHVKLIRDVTFFNVRLARERKGVAKRLLPFLFDSKRHVFHHTLLISPPQHGKTTMLRDLVRFAGDGFELSDEKTIDALKVAVVDERSEIAGCVRGVPHFDVGWRTDVLDQCPKAEGMMMMLRAMSPQVLAVDEIGSSHDVAALQEVLLAGIQIFATLHGHHVQDLASRPMLRPLHEAQLFQRYVVLQRKEATHLHMKVYDAHGVCLATLLEPLT